MAARTLPAASSLIHDVAKVAQERGALRGALHQNATAVQRINLAAREVEFTQAIERAGDGRLGDVKFSGQSANRVPAIAQIAGQEYTELPSRQIGSVPANQSHNRITKDADLRVRYRGSCCHFKSFRFQTAATRRINPGAK